MNEKKLDRMLWACVALLFVLIAFTAVANATGKKPNLPTPDQTQSQLQGQEQDQSQNQSLSDSSVTDLTSVNSSQFYALSVMFPQASGCFSGVQGGGNDNDQGGFLGIHILNTSCWLNQVASTERDIEINARLLCGDRKYRNAVAYDSPRKTRQADCIARKTKSGRDEMAMLRDELERVEHDNRVLQTERAFDRQYAEEAKERCDSEKERLEERCTK